MDQKSKSIATFFAILGIVTLGCLYQASYEHFMQVRRDVIYRNFVEMRGVTPRPNVVIHLSFHLKRVYDVAKMNQRARQLIGDLYATKYEEKD